MKILLTAIALLGMMPVAFAAAPSSAGLDGYPAEASQAIVKSCVASCQPQAVKFKLKAGACSGYCGCYSKTLPKYLTTADLVDIGIRAKAKKNPSDVQMEKISRAAQACQGKLLGK